jgi:hypothetical protein
VNATLAKLTSFNAISQYAHALAGEVIVFHVGISYGWKSALIAAVVVSSLAAIEEFWFDQNYEDAATRGSNLEDWLFWNLGAWVGFIETVWRARNH